MDSQQISKMARLARIRLEEGEGEALATQLSAILSYAEKINQLDLSDVQPMSHATATANVFREDEVQSSHVITEVLEGAPQAKAPFFRVPKVISK